MFIRNDIDFDDPAVVSELLQLEFGDTFVGYSDADGGTPEETEEGEEEEEPREYVSREDIDKVRG